MKYRFYVYILYIVCEVKIYLKFNFFGFWFSIFSFRCLFVLFLMKEETKCRQTPPIFKYPFTLFSFSPFSFLSFCSGLVFVLFRLAFLSFCFFLLPLCVSSAVRRVAPRFSILPVSHEIMPGGNVNITCVAVGSPMPYVKWMQGAEDLTPEDDMPVGRNVLELTDVKDSANYTCVAMSSLGVIEAVAQITVKCKSV